MSEHYASLVTESIIKPNTVLTMRKEFFDDNTVTTLQPLLFGSNLNSIGEKETLLVIGLLIFFSFPFDQLRFSYSVIL
jgi:hypothetical protein